MTDKALIGTLSDAQVIALTLYAEARSEGPEGRIAVASVIRNRVAAQKRHFGWTVRAVCLAPWQFSCWNPGTDPNHTLLMDLAAHLARADAPIGPLLRECVWIAEGLLADAFVDNTKGATHYLTTALLQTSPPTWAIGQKPLAIIGGHAFMRTA